MPPPCQYLPCRKRHCWSRKRRRRRPPIQRCKITAMPSAGPEADSEPSVIVPRRSQLTPVAAKNPPSRHSRVAGRKVIDSADGARGVERHFRPREIDRCGPHLVETIRGGRLPAPAARGRSNRHSDREGVDPAQQGLPGDAGHWCPDWRQLSADALVKVEPNGPTSADSRERHQGKRPILHSFSSTLDWIRHKVHNAGVAIDGSCRAVYSQKKNSRSPLFAAEYLLW